MVVPYLPVELVDEIIDGLAGDTKSLLSCSLVSFSWVHRSRCHLFTNLKLHSLPAFQSWFFTGLKSASNHVRSLDLSQDDEFKWIVPGSLAGIYNEFSAFRNVESLSLTNLDLTLFDEHSLTHFFGHFSETLTSLSVKGLTVHPDALLFFLCMFPKLDDLKLDHLAMGKATVPFRQPTVTPRFRGKLVLSNIKSNGTSLLAPFLDPPIPLAFEDVCVMDSRFENPQPLKDLFAACQETMKKIKVSKIFLGKSSLLSLVSCISRILRVRYLSDDISQLPLIDLSPCKRLEEIRLSLIQLRQPSLWIEPILRTVTSARIHKITFETDFPTKATYIDSGINLESWSRLDTVFLGIAHALDSTDQKLELVFKALVPDALEEFNPVDLGRFLEGCRTKAVVRFEKA